MFKVDEIRSDFPMIQNSNFIYFDSGATSYKPQCVIDAVVDYYSNYNANIHRGDYDSSYKASKAYDDTRITIQKFLNSKRAEEIVFTTGATNSLNLVAEGYVRHNLHKGDIILTTEVEHASSILPFFRVAKELGLIIKYIPVNSDGSFDLKKYEECFKDNIKFVFMTYVSNVLGYIYPIKDIARIAHEHNAIISIDGAQAVPHIKVDVQDLDIDFISFSSHKMCGPGGVGVLYGKYELLEKIEPLCLGGGANARFDRDGNIILKNIPERFEAGTPAIEAVIGLNKAVNYLSNIGMENIQAYEHELVRYFIDKLAKLDNVIIYNKQSETSIVTFNLKGIFAQDAASYFNSKGFAVRSGNHCAKLLVNIIGTNDTIRASLAFYNTKEEIDKFIEVIKETTLEKCIEAVI